jgi:predicted nucleic acid-binding protein
LILYLDTSALVKIYVDEVGASLIRSTAQGAEILVTSVIAYAEVRSAFARKQRSRDLSAEEFVSIRSKFETDWPEIETVPVDDRKARRAGEFAEKYRLRGFDAAHLASAEYFQSNLGAITFACFDAELARAASLRDDAASFLIRFPSHQLPR